MQLSQAGLDKIATNEGFSDHLYDDHKGRSIGFGHLCTPAEEEKYKDGIAREAAEEVLREDASRADLDVNKYVRRDLTQAQFDALADFRYNEGKAPLILVARTANDSASSLVAIAAHMKLYNKVRDKNGQLVENAGLTARRAEEAAAFEGPA
jgi:GH24 family phage-related lysozyme (muramidase)